MRFAHPHVVVTVALAPCLSSEIGPPELAEPPPTNTHRLADFPPAATATTAGASTGTGRAAAASLLFVVGKSSDVCIDMRADMYVNMPQWPRQPRLQLHLVMCGPSQFNVWPVAV